MGFLMRSFVSSVDVTGVDVFFDEVSHTRPIVVTGDEFESLIMFEMFSCRRVMSRA